MTLEQAIPGLRHSPAGAIVAIADNFFDFAGPARAATTAVAQNWTNDLISQIRAIEPGYRYESFGFPQTLQGQLNQLNDLRWTRATALLRVKGELRPLEIETLKFIQARTDIAYLDGLKLLQAGRLPVGLSQNEALGNYIDRRVRKDLRKQYERYGIDAAGKGPIRVNRREGIRDEGTFRLPDARVGRIAFDVTLTQKTLKTAQIRGFFATDFQPTHVVIIRPRGVDGDHAYIITRLGTE